MLCQYYANYVSAHARALSGGMCYLTNGQRSFHNKIREFVRTRTVAVADLAACSARHWPPRAQEQL
jgi:hypothetical protein